MAKNNKPRRRFYLVLGIVTAISIFALAVDRTGVSLDEITSESRQEQLVRIIRALAQPELVTYDFDQINTDVEFSIPCVDGSDPASSGGVTVNPGCGEPKEIVTVSGSDFDSFAEGRIQFIPDSEFDVSLPLGIFTADENGEFSVEVELPDRLSDELQIMRVVVPIRLGSWTEREEVWTDTNDNGVIDEGIISSEGLVVTVEDVRVDVAAAALLDPTAQTTEFITNGEPIIASDGPARGATAEIIGTSTTDISIVELVEEGSAVIVSVAGPEGTDLSRWRVAIYEGVTGEVVGTSFLGDQIEPSPRVSEQTLLTIDKIVDTVFLADRKSVV